MQQKDNFTDLVENLPKEPNQEPLRDALGNQQVTLDNGEVITLSNENKYEQK